MISFSSPSLLPSSPSSLSSSSSPSSFGFFFRVLLGLFCLVSLWIGGIECQCSSSSDPPVSYASKGQQCGFLRDDGVMVLCKNYLVCSSENDKNVSTCLAGTSQRFSDYPYGVTCSTFIECPTPLSCIDGICDYSDLPNGYHCQRDTQCGSGLCQSEICEVGDEESVGDSNNNDENNLCVSDFGCSSSHFCNIDFCSPSLEKDESCNGFEDSVLRANYVCEPGTACLPVTSENYTCQEIFSGSVDEFCGTSSYKCEIGSFCNSDEVCEKYPNFDGKSEDCDSVDDGTCPYGYFCSCDGTVIEETEESECESYFNDECSRSINKYFSCLDKENCPFDPFSVLNNPNGAVSKYFLGPLNRFSCAALECQEDFNEVVKCQNDGFSKNTFTPARTPIWSKYYDASFKGWQLALVVVAVAVGIILVVSITVLLVRDKSSNYESIS